MKQLWQHPTAPRRNRAQIRCAGIAVVAALAGMATVAPAATAHDTPWQQTAVAIGQEQCSQDAWQAFPAFAYQDACDSTMVSLASPTDSDGEDTKEPPPECEDLFGFRPNTCP